MKFYYAYLAFIAAIILYINTITIIKKVKKDENTSAHTFSGCICIILILVSIFEICGK